MRGGAIGGYAGRLTSSGGVATMAGLDDMRMPMTSDPSSGSASQNDAILAAACPMGPVPSVIEI